MDTEQFISRLVDEGAQKPLPHPMTQTMMWLFGTVVYLGILASYFGFRGDIADQFSDGFFGLELILLLGMAASAALAAFCLSRPDAHQKPWIKFIPFGFLIAWVVTAFAGSVGDLQLANILVPMGSGQFDCPLLILLFSVPPGIALFLLVRKGATVQCCWAGSMAAWAVTAFAYMLMRLIEQNDSPAHLLIWHVLPIVLICTVGMMVGKFALRWR